MTPEVNGNKLTTMQRFTRRGIVKRLNEGKYKKIPYAAIERYNIIKNSTTQQYE